MNDKCAASSGRYLENMAKVLDISLEDLSRHYRDPVPLDATCGIFGESELIGKIIEGHSLERLCAGVNNTLIKRVAPMLRRFPTDTIVLTGGVAKSPAFRELLQEGGGYHRPRTSPAQRRDWLCGAGRPVIHRER
jgi:activator of 2-hydroxyglutaryl-CoA dehydratase